MLTVAKVAELPRGPDLSPAEVDEICRGYKQNAAKVRFLRGLNLTVRQRPDGSPLVNRRHYDAVLGGSFDEQQSAGSGPIWGVHRDEPTTRQGQR